MAPNLDPSAQNLAIAICLVLVAYVFYFLGSNQPSIPNSSTNSESNFIGVGPSDLPSSDTNPEYLRGFEDGRKAFLSLGIHDLKRDARLESKRLEQELKNKIEEADKQEKARQQWFEEELESRWRRKQAEEKGIVGWFRFGGKRREKKEPEQSLIEGNGKEYKEKWTDEKNVVEKN